MITRIEGESAGSTIEVKRFYLPGLRVYSRCPHCQQESVWDGDEQYLSYPSDGSIFRLYFMCQNEHCEHFEDEWTENVLFLCSIRLHPKIQVEKD